MEFNLKKILKALLFSTSDSLTIKDVQAVITRFHEENEQQRSEAAENTEREKESEAEAEQEVMEELMDQVPALLTATQIRDAMDEIARDLEALGEVYALVQGPKGYRITVSPLYADWVRLLRDEPRPTRLSPPALETLAIIAYRQPCTRAEMESIRGVSVDSAVNRLLEFNLVQVTGRADLPGRPLQYGTTDNFLDYVGVKSTDELPASDVLSHNEISEWLTRSREEKDLGDKDMGLPEEEDESKEATQASEPAAEEVQEAAEPEAEATEAEPEPTEGA